MVKIYKRLIYYQSFNSVLSEFLITVVIFLKIIVGYSPMLSIKPLTTENISKVKISPAADLGTFKTEPGLYGMKDVLKIKQV